MKKFDNYRYVILTNKVIAISTYAGRTVRGVAKCSPNDKFDIKKGMALAAARCNEKVAQKRMARARKMFKDAYDKHELARQYRKKCMDYQDDAADQLVEAKLEVKRLLENM